MNDTTSTTAIAIAVGDQFRLGQHSLTAEVIATNDYEFVLKANETAGNFYVVRKDILEDQDGDLWVKIEPETVYYRNVYLDGLGYTLHPTYDQAFYGTKFCRTRIGIQKVTQRGGLTVNAEIIPTEPRLRTRYCEAHNPFAA